MKHNLTDLWFHVETALFVFGGVVLIGLAFAMPLVLIFLPCPNH